MELHEMDWGGGGILTLIEGYIEYFEDKCQGQSLNDLEGGHLSTLFNQEIVQYSTVECTLWNFIDMLTK